MTVVSCRLYYDVSVCQLWQLPYQYQICTCVFRAAREVVFIERKTEDIFDKSRQQQLLKTGPGSGRAVGQSACDAQQQDWLRTTKPNRAVRTVKYYIKVFCLCLLPRREGGRQSCLKIINAYCQPTLRRFRQKCRDWLQPFRGKYYHTAAVAVALCNTCNTSISAKQSLLWTIILANLPAQHDKT